MSDKLAINQQYTFVIPYGSSDVFVRIKSGKTLYENSFQRYDDVCLKVTGTIFKSDVSTC